MLMPSPEEFDALARLDFNVFVERVFVELNGSTPYLDNFHIAATCSELMAVNRGDTRRLAIAMPPRSLKSIIVSVAFPAWLLGHDPSMDILCASYGQQLSEKLARDCRQVMLSDWYRHLFPGTRLVSSRLALTDLATTAGGHRRATSVGGPITGIGADLFIVDDPTKPEEALSAVERVRANDWARHTLFTRLDDKARGKIVIVMQRLHEDDMIGFVSRLVEMRVLSFSAIAQRDEDYEIETPFGIIRHHRAEGEALHPEREPLELLAEIREALGEQFFSAQFLQMPAPPGGSIIKVNAFGTYDQTHLPQFERIIQSWDTANKSTELADYSVCTTWGRKDNRFFLLNVLRKKLEFYDLHQAVLDQARLWNASHVLIENAGSGMHLLQCLKRDGFYRAQEINPNGDKEVRAHAIAAVVEAGQVMLPMQASWLEAYVHELMMFPASRYDDQVDSTTQALSWLTAYSGPEAWLRTMDEADRLRGFRP